MEHSLTGDLRRIFSFLSKEQTWRPESGQSCLVALYIDKSHRLCATMKVYEYLKTDSDYQKNDYVEGIVYQINEHYGAFVAVDGKYHGMIPAKGVHGGVKIGARVHARVVKVREDGKMELSMSETVSVQMDKDGGEKSSDFWIVMTASFLLRRKPARK